MDLNMWNIPILDEPRTNKTESSQAAKSLPDSFLSYMHHDHVGFHRKRNKQQTHIISNRTFSQLVAQVYWMASCKEQSSTRHAGMGWMDRWDRMGWDGTAELILLLPSFYGFFSHD
mmetsp:Transcript_39729/g.95871  ORF Transcript_39729/g.95871 Transcript_39729/m.95871 type:complete len:116 (+) Transcript_39729:2059-2406(+)